LDSLKRHAGLVLLLLVFNIVVWLIARFVFLGRFGPVDLWQAQMGLAQGLLLVNTLIIVWVSTWAMEQQTDSVRRQLALAEGEVRAASHARWQDNKPIVFTDRRDDPDKGAGHYRNVIRNVGGGFAVNVYCLTGDDLKHPNIWSLGALAAQHERVLDPESPFDEPHIIVAEGLHTRTRRWNPTLNTPGAAGGFVHTLFYPAADDNADDIRRETNEPFDDYAERHWAQFHAALTRLRQDTV
jgi:hypothetical protein